MGVFKEEGEFEAVTNFSFSLVGIVNGLLTGIIFKAFFPARDFAARFFCPFEDLLKPEKVRSHMQAQYKRMIMLTCDAIQWKRFINSEMEAFEKSPKFKEIPFCRNIGFQRAIFKVPLVPYGMSSTGTHILTVEASLIKIHQCFFSPGLTRLVKKALRTTAKATSANSISKMEGRRVLGSSLTY